VLCDKVRTGQTHGATQQRLDSAIEGHLAAAVVRAEAHEPQWQRAGSAITALEKGTQGGRGAIVVIVSELKDGTVVHLLRFQLDRRIHTPQYTQPRRRRKLARADKCLDECLLILEGFTWRARKSKWQQPLEAEAHEKSLERDEEGSEGREGEGEQEADKAAKHVGADPNRGRWLPVHVPTPQAKCRRCRRACNG